MKIKLSKAEIARLERDSAQLRITEVLNQSVEREIFETICQNLAFVHLKMATYESFEKSNLDLRELSSLILDAVRDIRNIPGKIYSGRTIENPSALKEILDLTNEVLNLGIRTIKMTGDFVTCQLMHFHLVYLNLHSVLITLIRQREIVDILIHGSSTKISCTVRYKGVQVNLGRLTKDEILFDKSPALYHSKLIRIPATISNPEFQQRLKTIHFYIPLNL